MVISHEHLDHVDGWFLERLAAHVPVYVPQYPSPVLRAKVLAGGDRPVHEIPAWEERQVAPDIRVIFVTEESPMNHDAAMVIRVGDETLLNMNDARLTARQLRKIRSTVGGTVEVAAIQGAGASWYPVCYRYDEERKRELSARKRSAKLRYVAKVTELVEPAVTLPFAGPPAFLDADLRFANDEMGPQGIFPDQQQVATWLVDETDRYEVAVLLPGDSWDTASGIAADAHWSGFSFDDREAYIESYAARRRPHIEAVRSRYPDPDRDLFDEFRHYFDRVLAMSAYFNESIDINVGFAITGPGGGDWSVDFRSGRESVARHIEDAQYTYQFASRWLPAILTGEIPWEDFFLSLRFEAWRDPDVYNDHLLGLLKFAWPDALEAVESYERQDADDATIDIEVEGVTYRIDRYCPHAGQDLRETGEVLPGGILRCLGHHFEFDLTTGECVNGRSRPIASTVISIDDRSLPAEAENVSRSDT